MFALSGCASPSYDAGLEYWFAADENGWCYSASEADAVSRRATGSDKPLGRNDPADRRVDVWWISEAGDWSAHDVYRENGEDILMNREISLSSGMLAQDFVVSGREVVELRRTSGPIGFAPNLPIFTRFEQAPLALTKREYENVAKGETVCSPS